MRYARHILSKYLNEVDDKFKTLADFILKKSDNIQKELEGRKHAKLEMKETITSLEYCLMK